MNCEIIEEPIGKQYKKLMKYAIKKSDVMMFVIRRDRYIKIANYKIIKRVSDILNVKVEDIETNYMSYIENQYEKLYENYKFIFREELGVINELSRLRKIKKRELIKERLILWIEAEIEGKKEFLIQDEYMKKLKERLRKYLVKERHDSKWTVNEVITKRKKEDDQYLFDICFYKICPEVEKFLLESVNSLYAFNPPYLPEDIAFYKDSYCWFYTVTHEKRCEMDIENIEEYNYIENMGIKIEKYEIDEKDKDLFEKFVLDKK